jgi:hypothetical protein
MLIVISSKTAMIQSYQLEGGHIPFSVTPAQVYKLKKTINYKVINNDSDY